MDSIRRRLLSCIDSRAPVETTATAHRRRSTRAWPQRRQHGCILGSTRSSPASQLSEVIVAAAAITCGAIGRHRPSGSNLTGLLTKPSRQPMPPRISAAREELHAFVAAARKMPEPRRRDHSRSAIIAALPGKGRSRSPCDATTGTSD